MSLALRKLPDLRIPGQESPPLNFDGQPLLILETSSVNPDTNLEDLTPAVGIATVLYSWCPESLLALLDFENWFSFTWILNLEDSSTIEIGRIRNVLTFGTLDDEGKWKAMLSYTISEDEERRLVPDVGESMLGEKNIADLKEVNRLARSFVSDLILNRRWETSKGLKHECFIEHAPLDPWEDGIKMNPHWLYQSLDLMRCTTCGKGEGEGKLSRCSRCGTAAYCSAACQKGDWAVHKAVCAMELEGRGKALHLSKDGGLVALSRANREKGNQEEGADE